MSVHDLHSRVRRHSLALDLLLLDLGRVYVGLLRLKVRSSVLLDRGHHLASFTHIRIAFERAGQLLVALVLVGWSSRVLRL